MSSIWTTYCFKHEDIELVGDITKVSTFIVHHGSRPTGRSACEVWAITASGCKVHFIGGAQWAS